MSSVKDFLSLNNLKKVNKDLNTYIDENSWEDGTLNLTWQGFVENQFIGYGRNGASKLVDLQKIIYECEKIDLVRSGNANYSFINIYLKAKAHAGQGCKDSFTRMRFKDKKGNVHTMDELTVDSLISQFGRIYEEKPISRVIGSNVLQFTGKQEEVEISEQVYSDMLDTLRYHSVEKFARQIEERGFVFVDILEYTHKFSFSPETVKVLKNSITFAYMTNSTYNSLPVVITIEKVKQFKELSLAELGIEKPGYYSHHDKMTILPEQKEEVLEFQKQFNSLF